MSRPFRGVVNLDIRDSARTGRRSPSRSRRRGRRTCVYVVLDDVGFGALGCYGGLIDTPNIDRIAAAGLRYTQWHTTALCSPTRSCLLTGRNHTTNGMACITEAATGFPNGNGHVPAGVRHPRRGARRARDQHRDGRQVAPVRRRTR